MGKLLKALLTILWDLKLEESGLRNIEPEGRIIEDRAKRDGTLGKAEDRAEYWRVARNAAWSVPRRFRKKGPAGARCTDRQIARLIAEGMSKRAIADKLGIGSGRYNKVRKRLHELMERDEDGEQDEGGRGND